MKFFLSATARNAEEFRKHIRKILNAQRDLLTTEAVTKVETALSEVQTAVAVSSTEEEIKTKSESLEDVAQKWLKPYPHAAMRENIEVLLVALSVAMAIRTFAVQPFKIPTGSMQPTLFGVTSDNLRGKPGPVPPGLLTRIYEGLIPGVYYHHAVAEEDCEIVNCTVGHFLKFINTGTVTVKYAGGYKDYNFWMTPEEHFPERAGLSLGQIVHKGEDLVNLREVAGDHLFVDRISYNFRHPNRGEIIVFETQGIGNDHFKLEPGLFYIKRMVAMGGESVRIGDDRHLVIDGNRLDTNTPHFQNVYNCDPKVRALDSHYSGHLNATQAAASGLERYNIAPLFPDESTPYQIPPNHYMVMGDNTANSFDSRAWGEFSRTNVIGKYFFVYWPFTKRFGWNVQ